MDETMAFLMPRGGGGTMLAAVNEHLAVAGLSITREDALMLAERRVESLAETERIEFGPPAVAAIAKAIASLTSANECNEKELRPNLLGLKDARIGTIRGWKNTL